MSTRCNIHFNAGDVTVANVYRHCDGYPEDANRHSVPASLARFFTAVEAQTRDTRYSDPEYLAARFVVWQAGENTRDPAKPLAFLSLGVCQEDHGDIEWIYTVDSLNRDEADRPSVTWVSA